MILRMAILGGRALCISMIAVFAIAIGCSRSEPDEASSAIDGVHVEPPSVVNGPALIEAAPTVVKSPVQAEASPSIEDEGSDELSHESVEQLTQIDARINTLIAEAERGSTNAISFLGGSDHDKQRIIDALRPIANAAGEHPDLQGNEAWRVRATWAIAKLGDAKAMDNLTIQAREGTYEEQEMAIDGLAYVANEHAQHVLVLLLQSQSSKRPMFPDDGLAAEGEENPLAPPVRYSALAALESIASCPGISDDPEIWTEEDIQMAVKFWESKTK